MSKLQIFEAIRTNNAEEVRKLVEGGLPVDTPLPGSHRPLVLAAQFGNLEVMQTLLDLGATPNDRNDALNPILAAAQANHSDCVTLLENVDADASIFNRFSGEIMVEIKSAGQMGLRCTSTVNGEKIGKATGGGYDMVGTVVGEVLNQRYAERMKGIHPDNPNYTGKLYGLYAKKSGGVHIDGACGISSVTHAFEAIGIKLKEEQVKKNSIRMFKIMDNPMAMAAEVVKNGNNDLLETLIAQGLPLNAQYEGSTLLDHAVTSGQPKAVQVLLDNGADPNKLSKGGYLALNRALQFRDSESAQLLLNAGSRVDVANPHTGDTTLHYAIDHQMGKSIIEQLLQRGADPQAMNKAGKTPSEIGNTLAKREANKAPQGKAR